MSTLTRYDKTTATLLTENGRVAQILEEGCGPAEDVDSFGERIAACIDACAGMMTTELSLRLLTQLDTLRRSMAVAFGLPAEAFVAEVSAAWRIYQDVYGILRLRQCDRADGPWDYFETPVPARAIGPCASVPCWLIATKNAGLGHHHLILWEDGREAAIRTGSPHIEYDVSKRVYRRKPDGK